MIKKSKKPIKKQPVYITQDDLSDVLKAVNRGFDLMEGRFKEIRNEFQETRNELREIKDTLKKHATILDGHTKMLERIDQERIFTEYAVKRVENEIETIKKRLHASA